MKIFKTTIIILLVVQVIMQFIRPAKNISTAATGKEIEKVYPVPDSVQRILAKACYDCHSNNTQYPWYAQIQPVGWWLSSHIKDGKEELNFSEFGNYPLKRQSKKLKKSAKEVQDGGMPLSSYTLIHKDAVLTDAEKQAYITWANTLSNTIAAQLPPDEKK